MNIFHLFKHTRTHTHTRSLLSGISDFSLGVLVFSAFVIAILAIVGFVIYKKLKRARARVDRLERDHDDVTEDMEMVVQTSSV